MYPLRSTVTLPYHDRDDKALGDSPDLIETLSPRETQMIRLAAQGLTDREICERLDLSLGTVSTYWLRCRQKLRAPSRAACVAALMVTESIAPSRHEVRWNTLFEAIEHPVLVISSDLKVVAANPAAASLAGVSVAKLIGTDIRASRVKLRTLDGIVVDEETCPIQRCFNGDSQEVHGRFEAHTPSGGSQELVVTVLPMVSDAGDLPREVLLVCEMK